MRAQLDSALSAFLSLVDADLLKIPRAMRSMSLGELESCWAGSFAETSRAIAQRQFNENVPSTDEASVMAAAKRYVSEGVALTEGNATSHPLAQAKTQSPSHSQHCRARPAAQRQSKSLRFQLRQEIE